MFFSDVGEDFNDLGQEFHGFGKDFMLWVNSRLDFGGCGYGFL